MGAIMKKLLFALSLCAILNGGELETNLKNLFPTYDIISIDKINSIPNSNLIVLMEKNSNQKDIIISDNNGQNFFYIKNAFLRDKNDKELYNEKVKLVEDKVKKEVLELLKTIPDDRFITINSFYKDNKKTLYMVTDPECPDCRKEIDRLIKYIRNANLKIIFAPVHGKSAFTKSAIMLEKSKSMDPSNQQGFIELLSKYYDANVVVSDDMATDSQRQRVYDDTQKIFSKGLVKGVPFMVEIEK